MEPIHIIRTDDSHRRSVTIKILVSKWSPRWQKWVTKPLEDPIQISQDAFLTLYFLQFLLKLNQSKIGSHNDIFISVLQ